jgi:hypothetical protein
MIDPPVGRLQDCRHAVVNPRDQLVRRRTARLPQWAIFFPIRFAIAPREALAPEIAQDFASGKGIDLNTKWNQPRFCPL